MKGDDMTVEEMYNNEYEFEDDEDDDSDWDPSAAVSDLVEIPKWFCINCTWPNIGHDFHCDLCGEHRESGILQRGFLASSLHPAEQGLAQNAADVAVALQDVSFESLSSNKRKSFTRTIKKIVRFLKSVSASSVDFLSLYNKFFGQVLQQVKPSLRVADFEDIVTSEMKEECQNPSLQSIGSDNRTAIGFDERMLLHEEVVQKSHPHPERSDRLRAIAASLAATGIFPGRCYPIPPREITREELLMVHSLENIEAVELTSQVFSSYFTSDTYANQNSARAARLAAGLCFDLAAAIFSGSVKNGFALVRPPGHHAGVKQAMGFCLHNNAAIAALAAQNAGAKKVLIIDWDVHHGNGTQEIFDKNKSVLYISLHRHEGGMFYPGTGSAYEVGTMGAEGYCVNVPWSRGGVGDNDYVFAFQQVVLPIVSEFDPDFTIISAGFDAARGDPLGRCDITPSGYAQMTQMCSDLSGGKLLVILEGGYNLRSISSSATAVIKVLLGENPRHSMEQVVIPTKSGLRTVLEVLEVQLNYWPSLKSKLSKLQSDWGLYALHDKKQVKKKKRRAKQLPIWWKLGRKRLLYRLWCKKLS